MASTRIKLDPQTIEAIARRVVEILERCGLQQRELVDAVELARRFGMERSWVYSHAIELGAVKLGNGPSLGSASILRSPPGYCGRLARDRRLTRPPVRVSGRASLRRVEGPGFRCCQSGPRGRTSLPLRLR